MFIQAIQALSMCRVLHAGMVMLYNILEHTPWIQTILVSIAVRPRLVKLWKLHILYWLLTRHKFDACINFERALRDQKNFTSRLSESVSIYKVSLVKTKTEISQPFLRQTPMHWHCGDWDSRSRQCFYVWNLCI